MQTKVRFAPLRIMANVLKIPDNAGLHDQSVFEISRITSKASLGAVHNALWKGCRYITPSGELSLLYSFHQLNNSWDPALA